jgi:hypothetical protein
MFTYKVKNWRVQAKGPNSDGAKKNLNGSETKFVSFVIFCKKCTVMKQNL